MSCVQSFSTSDLRSTAQEYKRDAAHKYKWAHGAFQAVGRAEGKPRPHRLVKNNHYWARRLETSIDVAPVVNSAHAHRKLDVLEGAVISDDYSDYGSEDEGTPSPAADLGVMYSFDAANGPSQGSQILTVALSKAVERFEERETATLVRNEYDVLDADGESTALSPDRKHKHKAKQPSSVAAADADEDYEFV